MNDAAPPPFEPFGDGAWRMTLSGELDRRALLDALKSVPNVADAVVTEQHALVTFEPDAPPAGATLASAIASARTPRPSSPPAEHAIAVRYDGPDLAEVAALAHLDPREVVARHSACTYVVATLGFAPGFAYLRGLDPRLQVPRRATPRTRVEPLSLGIAGPYTGIYPFACPGGWSLLGRVVAFAPFDPRTGARLRLGDRVRFRPEPA